MEKINYCNVQIDDVTIFYRQSGNPNKPTILLLHGFPTSSHMFRNLIPALNSDFNLIAPDYPGYGNSSMPLADIFEYSFDHISEIIQKLLESLTIKKYYLYVMDYGAPVGFRIAAKYPDHIEGLIIQNGNAYEEGLRDFWKPIRAYWEKHDSATAKPVEELFTLKSTQWQYLNGVRNKENISPDTWNIDQPLLDRPGNHQIQLDLMYDYRTNLPLYPSWQEYFRKYQPATLIVWGKNDFIFPPEGAHPYKKDLKNCEIHLLDTGHFALEEDCDVIAEHIKTFFRKK
jgi:pimeloyl-ACP methyl ester carboxylesterase